MRYDLLFGFELPIGVIALIKMTFIWVLVPKNKLTIYLSSTVFAVLFAYFCMCVCICPFVSVINSSDITIHLQLHWLDTPKILNNFYCIFITSSNFHRCANCNRTWQMHIKFIGSIWEIFLFSFLCFLSLFFDFFFFVVYSSYYLLS